VIEERLGKPIHDVFAQDGEGAFRAAEERITLELLADPSVGVLALGGGAVGHASVREALADHLVVWLDIAPDDAWERCGGSSRPLARDREQFGRLYAEREPLYAGLADAVVPAARSHAMASVLEALEDVPGGTMMLWAAGAAGDYPAYIGPGLVTEHRFWPAGVAGRRFAVTDGLVGRHYGDALAPLSGRVAIMPGEQSKTVAHAEIVWTELARAGMTRADVVVALGGGVVGDVAGFCAATYQRGIGVVHVPTTLVAQVDSAYGGKTGVDLPEAKNYVGAYHQPTAVLTDPALLDTLPNAERVAGYAEVLKTALIAGGALWERVGAGQPVDAAMIAACARTKLRVVAADERDSGARQVLNLGHTVGHAIETATGYARYRHGEAVGLGLLAALRLSGQDALRELVRELLIEAGLPTRLEGTDAAAVAAATARDKKRTGEAVPFVLVQAPGRVTPGHTIGAPDLLAAVRELCPP
jgi:shikimate kinase/3-dehydroquinate synthase